MKAHIEHIENNLLQFFPGKDLKVVSVFNIYGEEIPTISDFYSAKFIDKYLILKIKRPQSNITPLQFIKKHCGESYAAIYKMLNDLSKKQILIGQFENRLIQANYNKPEHLHLFLNVQSNNGKYSFPMQNFSDTCKDEDIISLFTDLFKEPLLLKNNPLIQKIAA